MANPADPGTFDLWITDRSGFDIANPKTGDTGTFDRWITDRVIFDVYVEAAAPAPAADELLTGRRFISMP